MKKIILLSMLFISLFSFSQETEFKFTKDGFNTFVVGQVPNKTQAELYKKALDWVSVTYDNPKEVIKAQIENDYIRIEGVKEKSLCTKILLSNICEDVKYQLEISFKDGKYKFEVISIKRYMTPSKYMSGGWMDTGITKSNIGYYKDGEIKKTFKEYPLEITSIFNDLNSKLNEFLMSDKIPSKKSDW